MAIKLKTAKDASVLHGVKALVYGKAGSGKTVLCGTAPKPVIISAESGLLSLRKTAPDTPVIEIKTLDDLTDAYRWATEAKEAADFWTVCLDSLSEIGEVVLSNAKANAKDPRQAYGELIERMGVLVRSFRDLAGKHVLMTAKQEQVRDEMTGTVSYGPSMPGNKLQQQLPYFFDEVFHLGVYDTPDGENRYRALKTAPDFQHEAKDRSGVLDPVEEPDFGKVVDKILKG